MRIAVTVHPNAKQPRIERDSFGVLHVYVHQPPVEGKANAAVTASLAEYFRVRKTAVSLLAGAKTKQKLFEIAVEDDPKR